jgi:NlpC/P60 family putative phage cell wall peptidase
MIRQQIVTEARSWIGTPFRHQARLKGVGVDCAGLLIGVARALELVPDWFDVTGYARLSDGQSLIDTSETHMTRIDRETMQPGDVIVIRWGKWPQHFAILGDYCYGGLSMIHAYCTPDGKGKVMEHRLAPHLLDRLVAVYAMPGVT